MNYKRSISDLLVPKGKGQAVALRKISALVIGLSALVLVTLAAPSGVAAADIAFLASDSKLAGAHCPDAAVAVTELDGNYGTLSICSAEYIAANPELMAARHYIGSVEQGSHAAFLTANLVMATHRYIGSAEQGTDAAFLATPLRPVTPLGDACARTDSRCLQFTQIIAAPLAGDDACARTDSRCLQFTQIIAAPLAGDDACARTDSTCLPFTQTAEHLAGTVPHPPVDLNGDSSVSTVRLASSFEGLNPTRPVANSTAASVELMAFPFEGLNPGGPVANPADSAKAASVLP